MKWETFLQRFPKTAQVLFEEIYSGLKDSQIQLLSSSLAFTTLFAIVPLLAVFLSAFQASGGFRSLFTTIEPMIMTYLAPGSGESVVAAIREAISRANSGTMGTMGFFILLASSMRLMLDLELAFQKIWRTDQPRTWTGRILIYWGMLFLAPLGIAVVIGFVSAQANFSLADFDPNLVGFVFLFVVFSTLYKVIPPLHVKMVHSMVTSFLVTVSLLIGKDIYQFSTNYMITYNKIYGSLASVPFFLLWLLIVWWIILGGAIFAAAIRRHDITMKNLGLR